MVEVFVGVGSNIEPRRHVRRGMHLLRERFGEVRRSPVYRTRAVGFAGDDFLNLVVAFHTDSDPAMVVQALRCIEAHTGRQRHETGLRSRTLDLDLLLYGDEIHHTPRLRLPRPDIQRYAFVLKPLADLAGERPHPESGQTFAALWADFAAPADQALTPVPWDDERRP